MSASLFVLRNSFPLLNRELRAFRAGAHYGKWHLWPSPDDMGYADSDGRTNNNHGSTSAAGMGDDPKLLFSVTERGLTFMEEQVAAGNPFYLQLSHYACHQPYASRWESRELMLDLDEIKDHYGKRNTDNIGGSDEAARYAMIYDLDATVGQVLDKIDSLQIKDNTYVIFTSDNGVNNKVTLKTITDFDIPFKGAKWWLWEAGVRVPLIMTGPTVQKGVYTETPVIQYDFLPTLFSLAGGSVDSLTEIDGVDFSGVLQGGKLASRDLYFHFPHATRGLCHSAMIDTSDNYKIMHFYNATEEDEIPLLFDLRKDEYESEGSNRAKKKSNKRRKMKQRLLNYLASVQAGMPIENEDYEWEKYIEWKQYEEEARRWGPHYYDN